MRGHDPIDQRRTAVIIGVVAQAAVLACSHQRDLDAIEALVRANGGASGKSGLNTGSSPPSNTVPFQAAGAVSLAPGFPILTVSTGNFTHYDQHDLSLTPTPITVTGQPFTLGQRFPFGSGDGTPGSAGYFGPIQSPVAASDLLRVFFWMRCDVPDPSINQCQSALVFEQVVAPYVNGGLELPILVGQTWTLFTQAFQSLEDYTVGSAQLTFRLGYPNQALEIGAIGLEDYGTSLSVDQLEALDRGPFVEVIPADSFASYGTAVQNQLTGTAYPFGQALTFTTYGLSFNAPEDSGLQAHTAVPLQANDLMLATFWAHCTQSDAANSTCQTSLVFEEVNSPYVNAGLETAVVSVRHAWQQYFLPFGSRNDYDANAVKLGLRLGYPNQTIEFGPISLRRYASNFSFADMPVTSLE